VQNPALGQGLVTSLGDLSLGLEVVAQLTKDELSSLVNLVTEATVSVNNLDIESNVAT
jgi:hypothetical protein